MGHGECMNRILKYILLFIIFFSISLPVSYLGIFFVKQKMLEHEIRDSMAWLEIEFPAAEKGLEKSYDEINKSLDLDVNSGGQLREFGRQKMSVAYNYYWWEYEKFVMSLPEKSLFYIGLDYYGKQGLRSYLGLIFIVPYNSSWDKFSFDSENDYMNRLYGYVKIWKAESGNENKDWWDDFEKSEFYEKFLNDVFSEMERRKEFTLDEAHKKTMNGSIASENMLKNYLLQAYVVPFHKRIAETAYNRYILDRKGGDFYSASFDSEMVFMTWQYFQGLDKWDVWLILNFLRSGKITNIYLDFIFIMDFAVIMAVVALIFWEKKFIKRVN